MEHNTYVAIFLRNVADSSIHHHHPRAAGAHAARPRRAQEPGVRSGKTGRTLPGKRPRRAQETGVRSGKTGRTLPGKRTRLAQEPGLRLGTTGRTLPGGRERLVDIGQLLSYGLGGLVMIRFLYLQNRLKKSIKSLVMPPGLP